MDPLSHDSPRSASNPVTSSPVSSHSSTKLQTPRSLSSAQSTRSIKDLVNRFNSASSQPESAHRSIPRPRVQRPRSPARPPSQLRSLRLNGAASPSSSPLKSPSRRSRLPSAASTSLSLQSNRYSLRLPSHGAPNHHMVRRGSDGSLSSCSVRSNLHRRSRSHADFHLPATFDTRPARPVHHHRRARSDHVAADSPELSLKIPNPSSTSTALKSPSRIPVRKSFEPLSPTGSMGSSANYFPATSAPRSGRLSAKPPPPTFGSSSSGLPTLINRRYDPKSQHRHAPTGQSLLAYVHAPPPLKSPPLRSSRPRQPISATSTAASRAGSGQRFESTLASKNTGSATFRSRKIPELTNINVAARKQKIQQAFSDHTISARSSFSGSTSRRVSNDNDSRPTSRIGHDADFESHLEHTDNDDSLLDHTDNDTTDAESVRDSGRLSPTTPRNVPGAYVDWESPDKSEQPVESLDEATSSPPVSDPSPQLPNMDQEFASDEETSGLDSCDESPLEEQADDMAEPSTLLSQVMRMRERSVSSSQTDFDEGSSFGPSDSEDQESVRIMLGDGDGDDESAAEQTPDSLAEEWGSDRSPSPPATSDPSSSPPQNHVSEEEDSFSSDIAQVGVASPWIEHAPTAAQLDELDPATPRKSDFIPAATSSNSLDDDKTPRQSKRVGRASILAIRGDWNRDTEAYGAVSRIANQYKETGSMSPELLQEFQQHVGLLSPNLSKAETADADSMAFLMDSMLREQGASPQPRNPTSDYLAPESYTPTDRTDMRTPEDEMRGTAIVYGTTYRRSAVGLQRASQDGSNESSYLHNFSPSSVTVNTPSSQYDASTPASQRLSTDTLNMQLDAISGAGEDDEYRPPPPPKDNGYSARSSRVIPSSSRTSTSSERLQLPEIPTGTGLGLTMTDSSEGVTREHMRLPQYSPPPPPPPLKPDQRVEVVLTDASPGPTWASHPTSPVVVRPKNSADRLRNFSNPRRPSMESMKPEMVPLPPSQSMSSFQSSVRPSGDFTGAPLAAMPPSPNPETSRLQQRKNVIRELVDTEYSYHQDMKIIEDIYKATVGDLITPDDKKALFGNVDQVEIFSLEFYDALRRVVAPIYVPARSSRWQSKEKEAKRASTATSASDSNQPSVDVLDDEKDRATRVGDVFQNYIPRMEKVYGTYLKNHDLANQRLSKLQTDPTVKCWLTECHNNANDITTAWDLDSLLVKPVQRLLKYPLLLRELVEATPQDHPDRKALEYCFQETMNASKRINDAKRRADLVEQVINRKPRGKSDAKQSFTKIFNRGQDKLREGVGAAQQYKDIEYDEIASKFGGHYMKLQVVMRDVQASMAELETAIGKILKFATVLEECIELGPSTAPEIESKWRKFVLATRELCNVAFPDHRNRVQQHVIKPLITALKLSDGSQGALLKRKKRILEYSKCKAMQQRGEKPDKKTLEASDLYEALNEQLKIELPKLYNLTGDLVRACLNSNVYLQGQWMWLWKEKLAPVIDFVYAQPNEIGPAFAEEFEIVNSQILSLGICNGSVLADAANFLSPQTTLIDDETSSRRPSVLPNGTSRTVPSSRDGPPQLTPNDMSKSFTLPSPGMPDGGQPGYYGRMRSSSSLSTRGRAPSVSAPSNSLPPSRMPSLMPKTSFSSSRPSTAQRPADLKHMASRISLDTATKASPGQRPPSNASTQAQEPRFSGMFSSAMPMSDRSISPGPLSPQQAPDDTPVMFVAASLFEFNIDRARREAGYPYLTYVEGEVFDVVAQKGELWLAKNQDDPTNSLGWIWEQHFVILSKES